MMNTEIITQICRDVFSESPAAIHRFSEGIGNYVFCVEFTAGKYILRCNAEIGCYKETVYWMQKLRELHVPVPEVIACGRLRGYDYLFLSYLEGQDIGMVYTHLTAADKRTVAKEVVGIQNAVASLELEQDMQGWSWVTFVHDMLDRAEMRIAENGYFSINKVQLLRQEATKLYEYFSGIKSVAYLDDISSKNLLIHDGHVSGIIDIDWMGVGDRLTYVALTNMALMNLGYSTDYVFYILEEMNPSKIQRKAFLFYTLMYCVDFMGERGMTFLDKKVPVNPQIVDRLNGIFDALWKQWCDTTS